ncbi:hypothetical protein ATANTOWER_028525 [Ataeniobius toweri]|uniref:Uncharacterized protein n=1 Tax=Ataeniobius toweri TaxID=208326 RepID=A0ABU7ACE8_9TELE|nr:hypothetical protein [Ataeniobius toweri]
MVTLQDILRVSLFAVLLLNAHGLPVKVHNPNTRAAVAPRGVQLPLTKAGTVSGSLSSMPEVGYSASYGSSVPVQAGYYQPAAFMPVYDASSQQTEAAQSSLPEAKWENCS